MKKLSSALLFLVLGTAFAAVVALVYARAEAAGFSARAQPTRLEAWLARTAREAATPASVKNRANLVADSPEVEHEALAHYADHCAVCHANNGSGESMFGSGMYPKPPDLRAHATQNLTDGELFSILENGIRMSGMPAFGSPGDNGEASWKLVRFIRHLPRLTRDEEQEMQHLNPKSPDEIQEEKEEQEFLNGSDTPAPASHSK